ncbi:MAG: enoyl-CoA hydratase/isomerase family protein [Alphaproteobacteria bacterium]|nr:enoyl-CoA hydratase/isomerase family protein [Alphaproteobacteria bacterium]
MSTLKLTIAKDGIAVLTLAKPPVNAMDADLLEALTRQFEQLAADPAVRAVVVAAEGTAYSAGLDLKMAAGLDRSGQHRLINALNDCFGTLYAWPKPLVAAVNGHAIAGGLILALCGDWRVAADLAMKVSLAEVKVGVAYPVAPMEVSRNELSAFAARRLILLGETIDAAACEALGLFDERVPAASLLARAIVQAERLAELPPLAFATTKRQLRAAPLARIAAARTGIGEPRLSGWLGEEMQRAAAAALRGSSAPMRGAA